MNSVSAIFVRKLKKNQIRQNIYKVIIEKEDQSFKFQSSKRQPKHSKFVLNVAKKSDLESGILAPLANKQRI